MIISRPPIHGIIKKSFQLQKIFLRPLNEATVLTIYVNHSEKL